MNTKFLQQNICTFCDNSIKIKTGLFRLVIVHDKKRFCSHKCKHNHKKIKPEINLTDKKCLSYS